MFRDVRFEKDILRLQITVYQTCILQDSHGVQKLCHEDLDQLRAQALELVLLDELVQVGRKQLEYETEMVLVNEGIPQAENMMFVMRIALIIELSITVNLRLIRDVGGKLLTSSRIVTSIILWLKYAGLFFTTLTATTSCVFIFWHLTTCPNVP